MKIHRGNPNYSLKMKKQHYKNHIIKGTSEAQNKNNKKQENR